NTRVSNGSHWCSSKDARTGSFHTAFVSSQSTRRFFSAPASSMELLLTLTSFTFLVRGSQNLCCPLAQAPSPVLFRPILAQISWAGYRNERFAGSYRACHLDGGSADHRGPNLGQVGRGRRGQGQVSFESCQLLIEQCQRML